MERFIAFVRFQPLASTAFNFLIQSTLIMDDLSATDTTANPLDSQEAIANFPMVWNRKGVPIGIYTSPEQTMEEANRNTVLKMIKILPAIKKKTKMFYIGSGYVETVKYLVNTFNCQVDFLSLGLAKEGIDAEGIEKEGLSDSVTLTSGNFNNIPTQRETYDLVWAQDVFMYGKNKRGLLRKLAHILQPEGRLIFTDIMSSEGQEATESEGAIDLNLLETTKSYSSLARRADLEKVYIREFPEQLTSHYSKVQAAIKEEGPGNGPQGDKLNDWMAAAEKDWLTWGMLQFQKRNV